MTTQEAVLHPPVIIDELKKNNFTHVVWLPDSETNFMYQLLTSEPSLDLWDLLSHSAWDWLLVELWDQQWAMWVQK